MIANDLNDLIVISNNIRLSLSLPSIDIKDAHNLN